MKTFISSPSTSPWYSLTMSAVQELNLFHHTPFSTPLLPHPSRLCPTSLVPVLSGFRDQPYYFCLHASSCIQTNFNHTLTCVKMQKGKEKLLDFPFLSPKWQKITCVKIKEKYT